MSDMDSLLQRFRKKSLMQEVNYSHLYTFEELLGHCRADGASIVIGFINWRKSLPSVSLSQLQAKIYKCDSASVGRGKKIDRNWLSGEEFLAHVSKIKAQ
ncbi:MAG: hypothetical protein WAV85_14925 [Rhodoferax sp.]